MSREDRQAGVRALARLSGRVDAAISEFMDVGHCSGDHVYDGARSGATWTAAATALQRRRCGFLLGAARDLRRYPLVAAAWRSGRLATEHVAAMLRVAEHVEAQLERDQAELIDAIAPLTDRAARRALGRWRESALAELDRSPDDPHPDDPRLNELSIREGFDGTQVLDGTFSGIVGKELAGLVAAEIDRCFETGDYRTDDDMTVRQRNADALLRLVRRGATRVSDGGEPHRAVTLLVDLNRLLGVRASTVEELLAWPCETGDGSTVPLSQVLDVMGDATINTVLGFFGIGGRFRVAGEVTTARHANVSQRRHLRVRDQQCVWPGCDAPATWCHAHHEPPWGERHDTTTSRLTLLCRHHHGLRHHERPADRFGLAIGIDGEVTVSRPDGTEISPVLPGHQLHSTDSSEGPGP